jgi:hypothetical protein
MKHTGKTLFALVLVACTSRDVTLEESAHAAPLTVDTSSPAVAKRYQAPEPTPSKPPYGSTIVWDDITETLPQHGYTALSVSCTEHACVVCALTEDGQMRCFVGHDTAVEET